MTTSKCYFSFFFCFVLFFVTGCGEYKHPNLETCPKCGKHSVKNVYAGPLGTPEEKIVVAIIKVVVGILFLLCFTLFFVSSSISKNPSELVGKWERDRRSDSIGGWFSSLRAVELLPDGTAFFTNDQIMTRIDRRFEEKGTWRVRRGRLQFYTSVTNFRSGKTDSEGWGFGFSYNVSGTMLTITCHDGSTSPDGNPSATFRKQ